MFHRVVYSMKRIYHFCCKFGIINFFQAIFNPRFIVINIHSHSTLQLAIDRDIHILYIFEAFYASENSLLFNISIR